MKDIEQTNQKDSFGGGIITPSNSRKKTRRVFVIEQQKLSKFSVLARVVLIVMWSSMILVFSRFYEINDMFGVTAFGGIIVVIFWVLLCNFTTTSESECYEYVEEVELENNDDK